MKKLIALTMVLAMSLTMLAACGGSNTAESTEASTVPVAETTAPVAEPTTDSATEMPTQEQPQAATGAQTILDAIWALYGDEEKFAVIGGNPEDMYMDGPGSWDMSAAESLSYNLLIPADQLANVDQAASMIHMMNANTFTSGVVHLVEGTDVTAFADTMKETILNNPWMCGFPERMVIADFGGNHVLIAFGVNDAMTPFCEKLACAYPEAQILHDEPLV